MPQATLFNPTTNQRQAVEVGSTNASQLMGNGWFLENSYNPQTQQSTYTGQGGNVLTYNPTTPNVPNLQIPNQLTTQQLQTIPSTFDISGFQAQQNQMWTNYQNTLAPSTTETGFQTQLNAIQNQIANQNLNIQAGLNTEEARTVPLELMTGRKAELQRQGNLQLQTLSAQESNLLKSLGMAKEARLAEQEVYKTGLSKIANDIDLQFKIQERIDKQNADILAQANTLTDNARQNLSMILETPGFSENTPGLQQLAVSAGLDWNIVREAIKANNDTITFDMIKQDFFYVNTPAERDRLKKLGYTITQMGGKTYAKAPPKTTGNTVFDYTGVKSALDASKGSDGYVNTDIYKQKRNESKDKTTFDKNFSYMLNPNDQSAKGFFTQTELTNLNNATWGQVNPSTGKTPEQGFLEMGISQDLIDMAISAGIQPKDLI
jgi:uncharacterized protein